MKRSGDNCDMEGSKSPKSPRVEVVRDDDLGGPSPIVIGVHGVSNHSAPSSPSGVTTTTVASPAVNVVLADAVAVVLLADPDGTGLDPEVSQGPDGTELTRNPAASTNVLSSMILDGASAISKHGLDEKEAFAAGSCLADNVLDTINIFFISKSPEITDCSTAQTECCVSGAEEGTTVVLDSSLSSELPKTPAPEHCDPVLNIERDGNSEMVNPHQDHSTSVCEGGVCSLYGDLPETGSCGESETSTLERVA
jgi:hypothetical protein